MKPLDDWLSKRDDRVKARPDQLNEAKDRADAVKDALGRIYPGAETYATGSVAHGDALSPLNDIDIGVILTNRPDLGPGRSRPEDEMAGTADELARLLQRRYPNLTAKSDNKRSIVLEFNEPAAAGEADFTCDVIIAVPAPPDPLNRGTSSLLIPNTELSAGWDENDPPGHVERLRQAEHKSEGSFTRTVRLVKHWRDGLSAKPFYSWNIKTLALEAGTESTQPFEGLYRFFEHAVFSVAEGPTENPGSANYPPPSVPTDRLDVVQQLKDALATLERARMYSFDGRHEKARQELIKLFPEDS